MVNREGIQVRNAKIFCKGYLVQFPLTLKEKYGMTKKKNIHTQLDGCNICSMLQLSPASSTAQRRLIAQFSGLLWEQRCYHQSLLCALLLHHSLELQAGEETGGSDLQWCTERLPIKHLGGSLQSLDHLWDDCWLRTSARCRFNLGHRSAELGALLWPIGEV